MQDGGSTGCTRSLRGTPGGCAGRLGAGASFVRERASNWGEGRFLLGPGVLTALWDTSQNRQIGGV